MEDSAGGKQEKFGTNYDDETLSNIVEDILKKADLNSDGFIDWFEYKRAEFF